jgi:hypothetical protein
VPTVSNQKGSWNYDLFPDKCPLCHRSIQAIHIAINVVAREGIEGPLLEMIFRCPNRECKRAFIGYYWQDQGPSSLLPGGLYLLRGTAPHSPEEPNVAEEVKNISPSYSEILGQSLGAESSRLDQIAGCGYRKALEFLIKDYAIHTHPSRADVIKKKTLSSCIQDYATNPKVKSCASRATWLGNDETHYDRKWKMKDISIHLDRKDRSSGRRSRWRMLYRGQWQEHPADAP